MTKPKQGLLPPQSIGAIAGALSAAIPSVNVAYGQVAAPSYNAIQSSHMTPNDQALLDSRIAQSEAKTDGKFAELRGDLKVVSQGLTALKDRFDDLAARLTSAPVDLAIVKTKVEHLPGKGFVVTAAVGSVTALTAILIMLQKLGVLH